MPIHDTDVAEERWAKAEWEHYELWERIELRIKRRKGFVVLGAAVIFLTLLSIPVVMERLPKWRSQNAVRKLAEKVNEAKRLAATTGSAIRLRFVDLDQLEYVFERMESCSATTSQVLKQERLIQGDASLRLLDPDRGMQWGVQGLVSEWCYEPTRGVPAARSPLDQQGFAILPREDYSQEKTDRVSTLLLLGILGEISFD